MESPDIPAPAPRRSIPRPPHHRPGSPAPWADLPRDRRSHITLDQIRAALRDDHPYRPGQAPERWRTRDGAVAGGRPAAVLVPLFEEGGESRVVLTVRSDQLRSHRGEVAFPGGRLEIGEDVVGAALREAIEEGALDPSLVTVIGQLTSLPTVSSNTVMTPVVATLDRRPALRASPSEVHRIFDVSLSEFVADGAFIHIPRGVEVPHPIVITHAASGAGNSVFPHTLVIAGENSKATIVDHFVSLPDTSHSVPSVHFGSIS